MLLEWVEPQEWVWIINKKPHLRAFFFEFKKNRIFWEYSNSYNDFPNIKKEHFELVLTERFCEKVDILEIQ